jgi:hypothetical protein
MQNSLIALEYTLNMAPLFIVLLVESKGLWVKPIKLPKCLTALHNVGGKWPAGGVGADD